MAGFNPNDEKSYRRLVTARDFSFKKLEDHRNNRMFGLRSFVGAHYGPIEFGMTKFAPVNFIELAVNIYSRQLAASLPRVIWATDQRTLKPTVRVIQNNSAAMMGKVVLK